MQSKCVCVACQGTQGTTQAPCLDTSPSTTAEDLTCLPAACAVSRALLQLVLSSTKNLLHESGHNPPGMLQPPQHRSHQQHLEDHGVLKLLGTALSNPWLLALCFLGILLASASNTYVFFLPMIIQALLHGELCWPLGDVHAARLVLQSAPCVCSCSRAALLVGARMCPPPVPAATNV